MQVGIRKKFHFEPTEVDFGGKETSGIALVAHAQQIVRLCSQIVMCVARWP